MFGALKSSTGSGVRMLRKATPPHNNSTISSLNFEEENAFNWSQKRFLRCLPPSVITFGCNVNSQFTVKEIEGHYQRINEHTINGTRYPKGKRSLDKKNYRRSVSAHQSYLLTSTDQTNHLSDKVVADLCKLIIESAAPSVRVKSKKEEDLVKEWIGIQSELQTVKQDRIEDVKRKLQIAGHLALREMESNLKKGMNLEDLDEAIEGALCSELKDQ